MHVTFQCYPASRQLTFTCTKCGKPKRKRTLKAACTVNPFNRDASGMVLGPAEVAEQSRQKVAEQVERFMQEPVCVRCEGDMGYRALRDLEKRRADKVRAV